MVFKESLHNIDLITRPRENVAEPSSREDDLFGSSLRIIHGASGVHLRRTHSGHEGARSREFRVESRAVDGFGAVRQEAAVEPGDTIVA